jgi:inosine-uridine nucleoside N-ribohydrolase
MSDTRKSFLSNAELKILQDINHSQKNLKHLVIISDAGRDHDDEVALTVAAGLSKMGLLKIEGIVANLKPALSRAQLIHGILKTLHCNDIPIGVGSVVDEHSSSQSYEFDASYISKETQFPKGQDLLKKIFESAADNSLTLLLISGLTDANIFLSQNKLLAKRKLNNVVIMGGVLVEQNILKHDTKGHLLPDESYNHRVDMPSAKSFYTLAQEEGIPLTIVSRFCAMACAINPSFYARLAKENSPIGKRLHEKQADANRHLWKRVFLNADNPEREGLPSYCDKNWFLQTFTDNSAELQKATVNDDMWQHLIKLNAYDPIALLAVVMPTLFNSTKDKVAETEHAVIGINQNNPGTDNPEKVRSLLLSLSLWGLTASHDEKLTPQMPDAEESSLSKTRRFF